MSEVIDWQARAAAKLVHNAEAAWESYAVAARRIQSNPELRTDPAAMATLTRLHEAFCRRFEHLGAARSSHSSRR